MPVSFLCKPIFTYLTRLVRVYVRVRLFFIPLFSFFGVLGHEGVSRKTRTLEQAEWKQLGSYYTSPRIARRLVAASSYVVHTYIHGLLRKNNVYSKHYSTYILESAWRKRICWHGQICHCRSEYRYLLYQQKRLVEGTLILHPKEVFCNLHELSRCINGLTSVLSKLNNVFGVGTFLEYLEEEEIFYRESSLLQ